VLGDVICPIAKLILHLVASFQQRIKSFCAAKPAQKLGWPTRAGPLLVGTYGIGGGRGATRSTWLARILS